jgi:predicted MFS family arabinose efflux permease
VPAGLSIITTTFAEGPARNRALSMYTICGASGFSLGLVLGGLLTEVGWRATFLLPGPVALLLVAVGWSVVPRVAASRAFRLRELDVIGALTITAALLLTVYAVVEAPVRGWSDPATLGLFAVAAVLFAAFVVTELRHPAPLVRLGILRSAPLVHANLAGAVMFGSYAAFQFLATLYLQNSLGWSPLAMAMAFLPGGLLVVASATRIDRVLERVRTQVLIAVGLTSFLAGYALFLRVDPATPYAALLLPTILLVGAGFALTFPSVNSQATAGVADHEQGLASGLVNTSVQVGGAIMMAGTTAIIGSGHEAAQVGELLPNMRTGLGAIVGLTLVGALFSYAMLRRRSPSAGLPAQPVAAPSAQQQSGPEPVAAAVD